MKNPRSILITGASSGLGAALARHYAASGVHLSLGGRDDARLREVADDCRKHGATVTTALVDVTDEDSMRTWVGVTDDHHPLDLVIANAGISGGTGGGGEGAAQARKIFAVNLDGTFNTIDPIIPRMKTRGRGQIAVMSSLAGFGGWPGAPAYSAAKGAVRLYGEALRGALAKSGIGVSVICPGFIKTPMTDVNPYHMPLLMPADRAARIIAHGLSVNRARIAFPLPTYVFALWTSFLPVGLAIRLRSRMPEKPAATITPEK
ncbi:MAG TPA: SDR family NAD(P)-dependent oxidoreductase [Patescibacteria group bacterium]|nr:SDR family NAD(P)-dependent oxidoreductase [Patescibacteria group bacterium]